MSHFLRDAYVLLSNGIVNSHIYIYTFPCMLLPDDGLVEAKTCSKYVNVDRYTKADQCIWLDSDIVLYTLFNIFTAQ